jgi:uncharacterized repeat protein (TIGR03803 family)
MKPNRIPGKTSMLASAFLRAMAFAVLTGATLVTAQTEKIIYNFTGGTTDGSAPYAGVTADSSGALYGALSQRGPLGNGVIYKLTPPSGSSGRWSESIIYSFTGGTDGSGPTSDLAIDASGALYGITSGGGAGACGTVFQLVPPSGGGTAWTENTLYSFPCGSVSPEPGDVILDSATGNLYGVAGYAGTLGGGYVYQLQPPTSGGSWTYNLLHSFTNNPSAPGYVKGYDPWSLVLGKDGSLYGTTIYGGAGGGTVYKLSPPSGGGTSWPLHILYTFGSAGSSPNGYSPYGLVFGSGGVLYGVTALGGSSGDGTVYSLTPAPAGAAWTETILHNFAASADGNLPIAGVILGPGGVIYGTTAGGGLTETSCGYYSGCGTVFQLTPGSGGTYTETMLHEFASSGGDAINPDPGRLILLGGTLYGTSYQGGHLGLGAVFAVRP